MRFDLSLILLISAALSFSACSPKVNERVFQDPKRSFEPRYEDIDVRDKENQSGVFQFGQVTYLGGSYSMAETLRIAENLFAIKNASQEEHLEGAGNRLLAKLHSLAGIRQTVPLEQTPYAHLAIAHTEGTAISELGKVDEQVKSSLNVANEVLAQTSSGFVWPPGPHPVPVATLVIAGFLDQFSERLEKNESLAAPVKSAVRTELDQKKNWILGLGEKLGQVLTEATKVNQIVSFLLKLIQEEKMEIPASVQRTLEHGKQVGQSIELCQTAQSALTAIVDVWMLLDEAQRKTYVKEVNKDLYQVLSDQDPAGLECFRDPRCNGFFRSFVKKKFVLPRLEEYGVAKICQLLNAGALQFARQRIEEQVPDLFQQIPGLIKTQMEAAFSEKRKQLSEIQHDYAGFVSEKLRNWGQTNLSGGGLIAAPELGSLWLSLGSSEVKFTPLSSSGVSAESIGVGLSLSSLRFQQEMSLRASQQIGLEALNQLVALSGYRNRKKELIPGWLRPLESGVPPLDITRLLQSPQPFAVTDFLPLQGFQLQNGGLPYVNLSASGQAELLRGISQLVRLFRDWETTAYEKSLGKVMAQDLLPEFQFDELKKPIFPKGSLFALSIADAAVILKNLTKNFSPVFVVTLKNQLTWANEYDFQNGDSAVMAGVVNVRDGKRVSVVESKDVSRWILALAEFLEATEGLEKTQSKYLVEKGGDGSRPLDTLLEARQQLRLLLVGMSNFLSKKLIGKDGLVVSSLNMGNLMMAPDSDRTVVDQALAIRALTRAAQVTKVDVYQVSAIEIYYKMNFHLFNSRIRLYSFAADTRVVSLSEALEIVRSLTELKPFLPQASQRQLSWILKPWYDGFMTLY